MKKGILVINIQKGDRQYPAVCGYQRQIYPERPIQRRRALFQKHLHQLNQRCNYQDKESRPQENKIERYQHKMIHRPADSRRKRHNEDHGKSHRHGCLNLIRDAEERAEAEKTDKNNIVDQHRREKY